MGAISGLYAMSAIYDLVQDRRREKRLEEAMRRHGIEESAIKETVFALGYLTSSPEDRDKIWKNRILQEKYGTKTPEIRAKKEDGYGHLAVTVLRNPEFRHAWINNPKREAEIAKRLEDEETQFSERLNRLEAALRAHGKGEDSIGSFKAALIYDGLSPGGRDQMWEKSPMPKTPEARAEFDGDVQVLLTYVMYHPDLRHAWFNDAQVEAEIAKMYPTAASSG